MAIDSSCETHPHPNPPLEGEGTSRFCRFAVKHQIPAWRTQTPATHSAQTSLSPGLPLNRDPETDRLPISSWLLLTLLLAIAVAALAYARRGKRGSGFDWRRLMRLPDGEQLHITAAARLDSRTSVHVVEWDGRRLLVASNEHCIALLAEQGNPEDGRGGIGEPR